MGNVTLSRPSAFGGLSGGVEGFLCAAGLQTRRENFCHAGRSEDHPATEYASYLLGASLVPADIDKLNSLKSYRDLRQLVPQETFTQTMNFLSWHNRQRMIPMMEAWQALATALAMGKGAINSSQYQAVKSFFQQYNGEPPKTVNDGWSVAEDLRRYLSDNS